MMPFQFALAMCILMAGHATLSQAEEPRTTAPTREQTLQSDLAGPPVEWTGAIVETWRDNDATCFLLRRVADADGYLSPGGDQFIACPFGFYDPAVFAPGQFLRVRGNLGSGLPRTIGGRMFQLPLIAGAFVERAPDPLSYPPPYYGPYPAPYFYSPRGGVFSPFPCDPYFRHPSPFSRCW